MILRRLASAFGRQDWFTVAVETMIVVFGVFIGLQVNNWNAARIERGVATGEWPLDTMFVILDPNLTEQVRASNDPSRNGLYTIDGVTVLTPGWTGCSTCAADAAR